MADAANADARPPRVRPLTLRFDAPGWETAFREDYVRAGLTLLRISCAVGIVVGVVFGTLVGTGLGQRAEGGLADVQALSLVLGPPLILNGLTLWATFASWFYRRAEWVLGAGMVGWGLICALGVATQPDETTAIGGLFAVAIVALYAFVIVRAGFVAGVLGSVASAVAILATVSALGALPPDRGVLIAPAVAVWLLTAVAGYFGERYARRDFVNRRLLDAERARSEALLLNVLPAPIAARLKAGEEPIADGHDEVTVLFADVVDFTGVSNRASPGEVVRVLNAVFSDLDALAAQHGLEKIKTIGDAYMVVGGLPEPRPDHAAAVAEMALDIQRVLAGRRGPTGDPLRVRIGINTGPVVAGVIGTAKFAYDLWGDAVNTASRMESLGVPGAIQVTQATYDRLCDRYELVERGPIDVKGKGLMPAYLLVGRRVGDSDGRGGEVEPV